MKKPRYIRKEKGQLHLNTIVILILALLVVAAVMMGTGEVADFFKKVFGIMEAKHENADICERYKVITSEQDFLDLVYYVKQGYCGGDRKDDTFKFSIDVPSPRFGVNFGTMKPATSGCGGAIGGETDYSVNPAYDAYFCGGHYCNLQSHPEAPDPNPVYLQFGDVEMHYADDCSFPAVWEIQDQACISSDKSDLKIVAPKGLESSVYPCDYPSTAWWCAEKEKHWSGAHHLKNFVIKELGTPGSRVSSTTGGYYELDTWGIRRAGKDVLVCLMAKEV